MASTAVVLGVSLAVVGLAGRHLLRRLPDLERNMSQAAKALSDSAPSKYYRGGFEPQMSKREASLILGTYRLLHVHALVRADMRACVLACARAV